MFKEMANVSLILALISISFLVNSIRGTRLLAMAPNMNGDHNAYTHYSSISISPSPAPNTNNSSYHNNHNTSILSPLPAPNNNSPSYQDHYNNNVSSYCAPSPTPSSETINNISRIILDVRAFGAIGDGLTDDTTAFKSAWDSACQNEHNAQVLVPKGFSFVLQPLIFTGPCMSGVTLQIEGTIVAPDGPENWPNYSSKRQWIIFYRTHGLTFQGGGLVDGRGDKWWNLPCKPHNKGFNGTTLAGPCDSPVAIRFFGSKNLTVRGIRVMNSPEFHIRIDSCQNVTVDSLFIKSPADSPNTDGIHVENTSDVTIYNSFISNGDDCISIGAGSHNLDIKNVTCGPSHGISIGSLGVHNSRACVSNISVTNCLIRHSDNGVRIKTWQGGSGSVSAVKFDQIRMDMVRNPIMIDQYYCLSKKCSNQTSAVSVNTISYNNIKGTYDPRSPPVHLACSDSVPCTNITLSGVELQPGLAIELGSGRKHGPWLEPFCWNAYGTSLETYLTPISHCLLEGMPYLDVPGTDILQC